MRYYTRFNGDPYWTIARFNSVCNCGQPIKKGGDIFYYPKGKGELKVGFWEPKALCRECGEVAYRDFASCAADEFAYNNF